MYDMIIIGAGPAGLTAAIYAARAGRKTLVLDPAPAGGQAGIIPGIENYPGFESISGYELIERMTAQAQLAGAEISYHAVTAINEKEKTVTLDSGENIMYKALILATGCKSKTLGLPRESLLVGMGVSYCATCDGAFFRGRRVAVAGSGKKAEEAVAYLKNIASEVVVVGNKPIDGATHIVGRITALNGTPLSSLTVATESGEIDVETSALFVCVGYTPQTHLLAGKATLSDAGYVVTDEKMCTSIEGVYAAGDIRVTPLRQIVTAAADGAIAAEYASAYVNRINKGK